MYDALNAGRIDVESLRRQLAGLPLPRAGEGHLVLAVDVSPWLRPDGNCSPQRSFGRGKDEHRMIPGWPYSIVAALGTGRTSWTALLDAVRLPSAADVTTITCAQIRQLVGRLTDAGQMEGRDRDILIVLDAGYEAPCVAWLLRDLPVEILGRMRSDRVLRRATPPRIYNPDGGRPAKNGGEFVFGDPGTWNAEHAVTHTDTRLYGQVRAQAWDRLHPRLTHRAAWTDHDGSLPIIEGTVIRLTVDHLPSRGEPKPLRLRWSKIDATDADLNRCWRAFLRRFDIEHTFRLLKQTLDWTAPRLREPAAADRWTCRVIAAHTQPRLARPLAQACAGPGNAGRPGAAHPGPGAPGVWEPARA
ncbi:hypothetical protein Aph02nite_79930 [Actinoplanes philippinensis]|uniref:DDE superfamily endonuclease n=1 Tax=Actinoplanes philippinensis TaxID=35752 RepID=A0A1I2KQ02_9ACTN|nr:transposase [Actinoplanes philippinensis]GIE82043.1 hypothetical protein Aph02nite_79930 [Actinoplanes philippinensis]SFF69035.1 DDE superfamily endonuclease [Actinoplanes philippinensis]